MVFPTMSSPGATSETTTSPLRSDDSGITPTTFFPVVGTLDPVTKAPGLHQSVCFKEEFRHSSFEELRMADYEASQKLPDISSCKPTVETRGPSLTPELAAAGFSRQADSETSSETDQFSQTREDSQLFSNSDQKPRIRLPPLSGLDDYNIRRMYSPAVASMVQSHPELMDSIGSTVISFLESLAKDRKVYQKQFEKQIEVSRKRPWKQS
jgi:hypothetical protein